MEVLLALMILSRFIIVMFLIALIMLIVGGFIFLCISCLSSFKDNDSDDEGRM